jgi:hypothetical protein
VSSVFLKKIIFFEIFFAAGAERRARRFWLRLRYGRAKAARICALGALPG